MLFTIFFTITLLGGPDAGMYESWELGFLTRDDCEWFEAELMKQMIDYEFPTYIDSEGCVAVNNNEQVL